MRRRVLVAFTLATGLVIWRQPLAIIRLIHGFSIDHEAIKSALETDPQLVGADYRPLGGQL